MITDALRRPALRHQKVGPYKSALVAAPAATAARRVNWKIGKIYYIKCKS